MLIECTFADIFLAFKIQKDAEFIPQVEVPLLPTSYYQT